ncbi:MAG: hypothetical protein JNL70_22265 [Saprospiraceae bacterium]|nr:hypothetical protein [Saprospiraceae bacterium]
MRILHEAFNLERYPEHKEFDELLGEMQEESVNNGGCFHFNLLNSFGGNNLEEKVFNILSRNPTYTDPYYLDSSTNERRYYQNRDLDYLSFSPIKDLKNEIIVKAEYWATFSGPCPERTTISDKFHTLKFIVADKIFDFLNGKDIIDAKQIDGIDTFYSFGFDHMNDDIIVDTKSGLYIIHFGFSS